MKKEKLIKFFFLISQFNSNVKLTQFPLKLCSSGNCDANLVHHDSSRFPQQCLELTLIGVDSLQVHDMSDDVVFIRDAVTTQHVSRHSSNVQSLAT